MAQYLSPGVYVEEVDQSRRPIEGVSTSVAAFIGFSEKGPLTPTLVTSWEQYCRHFGGFVQKAYLPQSVYGFFLNGGTRCYIQRISHSVEVSTANGETALQFTPLLEPLLTAKNKAAPTSIAIEISNLKTENREIEGESSSITVYDVVITAGDKSENYHRLTSDRRLQRLVGLVAENSEAGSPRFVEEVINKYSQLVRVLALTSEPPELNETSQVFPLGITPANAGSPVAKGTVQLAARADSQVNVLEISPKTPQSGEIRLEVQDVAGQDNLFKLLVKLSDDGEELTLSFEKGANYIETVKPRLVALKDLSKNSSPLGPADRRPAPTSQLLAAAGSKTAPAPNPLLPTNADFIGKTAEEAGERTGLNTLEGLDEVSIVAAPDLVSLYESKWIGEEAFIDLQKKLLDHCEKVKNRVAILDAPPRLSVQAVKDWRNKTANFSSRQGTLYYPWLKVLDPADPNKTLNIPPSGHIAGIWARSDAERGVHKAPANEVVRGIIGLEREITAPEQDLLNPIGVNCLRSFPGRGIRVWGARTLSSDANWRYLNVRRLFDFVEASVERSMQWVVFEPNDEGLWDRIKRDINAFLFQLWMQGALAGSSAEEAYYVKCNDENNTPETISAGYVLTDIGLAPVKPAEFVIFRIGQKVDNTL